MVRLTLSRLLFVRGDDRRPQRGQVRFLGQGNFIRGRVGMDHLTYLPATVTGPSQAATTKSPQAAGTVKGT